MLGGVPFACSEQAGDAPNDAVAGEAGVGGAANVAGSPSAGSPSAGMPNGFEHACTDPELDPVSQLVRCAEGYAHRAEAIACDKARADETGVGGAPIDLTSTGCEDGCDSVPGGICVASDEDLDNGWECAVGCVVDEDCPARQFCLCGEAGGICSGSSCRTDSDCDDGLLCATDETCGGVALHCQHPDDECAIDQDCGGDDTCTVADGSRTCAGVICG